MARLYSIKLPQGSNVRLNDDGEENIILNPNFDDGLNNWTARGGCKLLLHDSMGDGKILPLNGGKYFASATERAQNWNGMQQEITGRVQRKLAYEVTAFVRVFNSTAAAAAAPAAATASAEVRATLYVQAANGREQYIGIAKSQATDTDWVQLQGKFLLNGDASKVVIFFEGPPATTDILLNSLVVKHAPKTPPSSPPDFSNVVYGVNIIQNSNLGDGPDGLNGWFALGPCKLAVANSGAPRVLPPMARDSIGTREPLSGRYIHVTNRTQTWMGPAQTITDKLQVHVTYQVSAWVRVGGSQRKGPENINVALGVDSQWVNGGQVEAKDERWYEIGGSFRIETPPASRVMVYVQGASAGVDLMLAGLQIFPVDRKARFRHLKKLTDQVRKRDVVLKFSGVDSGSPLRPFVKVRQIKNSFPFGACVMRTNIDNEDFVAFLVDNFNWAVFGNELKWYWTEPQQGSFNYADADELLALCKSNGIDVRGHCIFWEVESALQSWVRSLNATDLSAVVQNRLSGLLARYKDQFLHYDVNNEMLHGSFFQDRLGKDIRSTMFKGASQLDPAATLFVNDYNVEGSADIRATPETYIEQILGLQDQGAPVGGIGLQGHVSTPVGPVICSALDKLGILGLPIWFTEVDVSAANEFVRADDLEATLRESFAHPAVEGIVLWGFWELFMSRDNAHLVEAEGELNEAGRRYLSLKQEWLSHAHGRVDDGGEFRFRGFHGSYTVEVITLTKKITQTFTVEKGDSPVEVNVSL
ncbi:hypothetical protein Cni_G24177 [Canna indica]|uniref:GH10 domain-containing protein n=1 Tax=Canna indica TaxID=4628 RepID=A0AAQ3QJU8_9LILI|nr:hypothetical protein Cni_G24177 [Canna indica]